MEVHVPTDYLRQNWRLPECHIDVTPDEAVLDSVFGHDPALWAKTLVGITTEVQIMVDDDVRGLAMKNAVEKNTPKHT